MHDGAGHSSLDVHLSTSLEAFEVERQPTEELGIHEAARTTSPRLNVPGGGTEASDAFQCQEPCMQRLFRGLRTESLDLPKWRSRLVPLVLKTRTPFAAFLKVSIRLSHLSRRDEVTPTFFPVPLPYMGVFGRMPSKKTKAASEARYLSQNVHAMVVALNFWYGGGRFGDVSLMRRRPNKCHLELYQRLRSLCESEGPATVDNVPKAGRRFPELTARLEELSDMLTRLGATSCPYDKTFQGYSVEKEEPLPEAKPYQDMDPDKLLLFGRRAWDVTDLLPDDLVMAYCEPTSLLHGFEAEPGPMIRDDPATLARLARKWDDLGLLHVHRKPVHRDGLVRIFGAMKDSKVHRQIGDRRGQNARESAVSGPSRNLPGGADFTELFVDPSTHRLSISITDRKDFYHQISTTQSRAISNTIGPAVPVHMVDTWRGQLGFMEGGITFCRRNFDSCHDANNSANFSHCGEEGQDGFDHRSRHKCICCFSDPGRETTATPRDLW